MPPERVIKDQLASDLQMNTGCLFHINVCSIHWQQAMPDVISQTNLNLNILISVSEVWICTPFIMLSINKQLKYSLGTAKKLQW